MSQPKSPQTNANINNINNINNSHIGVAVNVSEAVSQPMAWPLMSRSQELSYVEALKTHQTSRLNHIRNEATKLSLFLQTLRNEVLALETQQQQPQQQISSEGQNWSSKISKLRSENRSLRIECHCLSMEVDLYASGQMPLGITDENFYKNIRTGPNGPLLGTKATPQQTPDLQGRAADPPSYEEWMRLGVNNACFNDILCQVPPAPRPVWLSPQVQHNATHPLQSQSSHSPHSPLHPPPHSSHPPHTPHCSQSPPVLPPRPNSISPRTPSMPSMASPMTAAMALQTVNNANVVEEGQRWVCEKCTVENHPALAYCEVCEMPRNGYLGTANRA